MSSDFLLIQRIKKSDEDATEIFVRKYYSKILKYCYIRVRDNGYAQDLAQNTFMKFFEKIDSYTHYGKALNFLYIIASNECNDFFRKENELLIDDIYMYDDISDIYDPFEKNEIKREVEEALDKLPVEIKETIILFFFQDLKQKDIAKILGIKLSLVKYRVKKGKEILRRYLEEKEI